MWHRMENDAGGEEIVRSAGCVLSFLGRCLSRLRCIDRIIGMNRLESETLWLVVVLEKLLPLG